MTEASSLESIQDIQASETVIIGGRVIDKFTFQSNKAQLYTSTRGVENLVSSYIGLGIGSTLLNRLYNDGLIATKAWTFFPGWLGTRSRLDMLRDGELIIGGYNANLLGDAKFQEFPISEWQDGECLFPIEISQVEWFGQKAVNSSEPGRGHFTACVNPGTSRFEFPYKIWEALYNFSSTTGLLGIQNFPQPSKRPNPILPVYQEGIAYWYFQNQLDNAYTTKLSTTNLAMTIKLKGGLEIVIPSSRIFERARVISNKSVIEGYLDNDDDARTAVVTYPSRNTGAKPTFGLPFLSSAYFMANYDTQTFGLAPITLSVPGDQRAMRSILPPMCAPKSLTRGLEARIVAPAVTGSLIIFASLVLVGVYRAQKKYKISLFSSPFISKIALGDTRSVQEMDATQPFEHEIDSRSIHELPGSRGILDIFDSKSVRSKRSLHELA
ncbi:hypothetical protein TWF281_004798 [Arthrobotrys megalospora]